MELLNNRYAFYMLVSAPPQTPPLSVNAFCIVTKSAHETPVYPTSVPLSDCQRYTNLLLLLLLLLPCLSVCGL